MNKKSVIVFGPKACGKTRNSKRIAKAYGLSRVIDDFPWGSIKVIPERDCLVLTSEYIEGAITYEAAMRKVAEENV